MILPTQRIGEAIAQSRRPMEPDLAGIRHGVAASSPSIRVELVARRNPNGLHWSHLEPAWRQTHPIRRMPATVEPARGTFPLSATSPFRTLVPGWVAYIAVFAGLAAVEWAKPKPAPDTLWWSRLWDLVATNPVSSHEEASWCVLALLSGLVAGSLRLQLWASATILPATAISFHAVCYQAGIGSPFVSMASSILPHTRRAGGVAHTALDSQNGSEPLQHAAALGLLSAALLCLARARVAAFRPWPCPWRGAVP